jgi:signal transduction histidine kinase
MQAAAVGSLALVLTLTNAGAQLALPALADALQQLGAALGLVSGLCYFVAFAPPNWLRRAWQEPELRSFLALAASMPRLPSTRGMVHALERGAADALGAHAANIALWDNDSGRLQMYLQSPRDSSSVSDDADEDSLFGFDPTERPVSGRAFIEQRASLVTDAVRADPANAAAFEEFGARAVLAAPITAGDQRLGVLVVYAPRAPVFADTDLELIQLLADNAAVIFESRALIDEAASVRAREEATLLKEDFLSSAAHDLKTPLTGLITQAQVLQRRAIRDPQAPVDRAGLDRLLQQSLRLRDLVLELLDVTRLEQGGLLGERHPLDLVEVVQTAVDREPDWRRVKVEAGDDTPIMTLLDATRFEQVLMNLIENALKYSAHDSPVTVSVWSENGEPRLSVRDVGIGIPVDDQPLVFDRFHRARNVDDRRFAGMGLGLYIARGIVEQHGGRIWLESTPGSGSTFFVALPGAVGPATRAVPAPEPVVAPQPDRQAYSR